MKTAISLPDPLFDRVENLAREMHIARSQLFALAIQDFIEKRQKDTVTEALNKLYSKEASEIDPFLQASNQALLGAEKW